MLRPSLKWLAWILGLLLCPAFSYGVTVNIEKVHEEPARLGDDPQDYYKIFIDGVFYRCAPLPGLKVTSNLYGMQFVVLASSGDAGFAGVRVEPFLDANGKTPSEFTKEFIAAQLKQLAPDEYKYETPVSVNSISSTSLEVDFVRIEDQTVWKCHYALRIVEGKLWTFGLERSSDKSDLLSAFHTLFGSFAKTSP